MADLMATLSFGTQTLREMDLGRSGSQGMLKKAPPSLSDTNTSFRRSKSASGGEDSPKNVQANPSGRKYLRGPGGCPALDLDCPKEAVHTATFRQYSGNGGELNILERLKPKVLDPWSQHRVIQPERSYKKAMSGLKTKAHVADSPPAHDGLCTGMHQKWLGEHRERRDKEMYKEHHALKEVDKAKEACEEIVRKRVIARDIMTRSQLDNPHFSQNEKKALSKVRTVVGAVHAFSKAAGISQLLQEEEEAKATLEKAKSVDVLRARPKTPEHRARHHATWAGAGHKPRCLRESTPWREQDDGREMGKKRKDQMRSTF